MGWATLDDVTDITTKTVSAENLAMAEAAVTIYSNRTPEASASIANRDLYWLRQATAWQATWEAKQESTEARQVVSQFTQDGVSGSYTAEWNVALGPLAARAIKNLSWKGSATRRVQPIEVPAGTRGVIDFTLESSDDWHQWERL